MNILQVAHEYTCDMAIKCHTIYKPVVDISKSPEYIAIHYCGHEDENIAYDKMTASYTNYTPENVYMYDTF